MPQLLLQKPHTGSKDRDHASSLDHRLNAWKKGDIDGLMHEAHTIQHQLRNQSQRRQGDRTAHNFAKLMMGLARVAFFPWMTQSLAKHPP